MKTTNLLTALVLAAATPLSSDASSAQPMHALAGDFAVVPPTVRAHRISSCEVAHHS